MIGLRGGLNGYSYANQNPLSFTDPLGLCSRGWKQVEGQQAGVCEPDDRVEPDKCPIGECGAGLPPQTPKFKTECERKCDVGLADLTKNTKAFFICEAYGEPPGRLFKTTWLSFVVSEGFASLCQAYYERQCIKKCEEEKLCKEGK